jgi:hypothetical protein
MGARSRSCLRLPSCDVVFPSSESPAALAQLPTIFGHALQYGATIVCDNEMSIFLFKREEC